MKVNHNFERIRGRRRVFSAKYEGYKGWLLWCDYGDEQNPHWCGGKEGSWKDCQSCLQYSHGVCTLGMKSVTCNFPKT